jgi:hypothetical protein
MIIGYFAGCDDWKGMYHWGDECGEQRYSGLFGGNGAAGESD